MSAELSIRDGLDPRALQLANLVADGLVLDGPELVAGALARVKLCALVEEGDGACARARGSQVTCAGGEGRKTEVRTLLRADDLGAEGGRGLGRHALQAYGSAVALGEKQRPSSVEEAREMREKSDDAARSESGALDRTKSGA